jgi:hypothetical protein
MSDRDLVGTVARKTGEDSRKIARRGFVLSRLDRSPAPKRTWPGSGLAMGHRQRADRGISRILRM